MRAEDDRQAGIEPYEADEDLIAAVRGGDGARFRVYPVPRTAVVLGRGSRVERECHLAACRADGVPVLRRRGGGCAVVLDPGNVVVAAVTVAAGLGRVRRLFDRFSRWVIDGLTCLGVSGIERRDVCDLCLGNRKVGGAALYRAKDLVFYSTTLLVDPDVRLMSRYLPHPPREPAYRAGRPHEAFVIGLCEGRGIRDPSRFASALQAALAPLQESSPGDRDRDRD
jgi:lipoate-protein ligase A